MTTTVGLNISKEVTLPLDFVTKTVAILAQRRKGKTHTASVIAEEMVGAGIPFVVLDPTGAWHGLRSGPDGTSVGLPVVILGGQHGDIPIERSAGRAVAELVIDQPGWYVIDFSLFESAAAEKQFATDFAERLYRRKAQPGGDFPMHLFIDEADRFVPQMTGRGGETDPRMLGAFEVIVRRGGLRGLGTTLISQRSAVVNKNVLEQIDMLIVLRTVGPNDRKRIDEYLQADGDDAQRKVLMGSLASLDIGEAWLWEPGGDPPLFDRVHIRQRTTFNSSATPKAGQTKVEPKVFASVDLTAVKEAMSESIEQAERNDPKALQRRLADLERKLAAAEKASAKAAPAPVVQTVEVERVVEVVPDGLLRALRVLVDHEQKLHRALAETLSVAERLASAPTPEVQLNAPRVGPPPARPTPVAPTRPKPAGAPAANLPGPQRKLLVVLATYGPRTKRQLALQAGYSESGGGFNNPLGALRSQGYVLPGQPIEITDAGLDALGEYEPLPTGQELLDHWLTQLPGPAARILSAIVARHPHGASKETIATDAGYNPSGGGFNNPLGRLRTLGLVTRGSEIALTDEFAEAVRP